MRSADHQILTKLIDKSQQNSIKASIYIPTSHIEISKFSLILKQTIEDYHNPRIKKLSKIKDLLVSNFSQVENLITEDLVRGYAIFCEMDEEAEEILDLDVVKLYADVNKYMYVGRTYDLVEFIYHTQFSPDTVVVSINEHKSKIFRHLNSRVDQKHEIENDFRLINTGRGSYIGVRRPRSSKDSNVAHHGHKDSKESEEAMIRDYVKAVSDSIDNYLSKVGDSIDYLVILYSHKVAPFLDQIISTVPDHIEVLSEQRNVDVPDAEYLSQLIKNEFSDSISSIVSKIEESGDMSVRNRWRDSVEAIRNANVDKLIIDRKFKKNGYVIDQKYPYSYAVRSSKKVNNLVPWLLNHAVRVGADVKIIDSDSLDYAVLKSRR